MVDKANAKMAAEDRLREGDAAESVTGDDIHVRLKKLDELVADELDSDGGME